MSTSKGRSRIWNHTRGFLRYVKKPPQYLRLCLDLEKENRCPENQHIPSTFVFTRVGFWVRPVDYAWITVFLIVNEIL